MKVVNREVSIAIIIINTITIILREISTIKTNIDKLELRIFLLLNAKQLRIYL